MFHFPEWCQQLRASVQTHEPLGAVHIETTALVTAFLVMASLVTANLSKVQFAFPNINDSDYFHLFLLAICKSPLEKCLWKHFAPSLKLAVLLS